MNLFFRNEFRKNDRQISKERYSIKRPIPDHIKHALTVFQFIYNNNTETKQKHFRLENKQDINKWHWIEMEESKSKIQARYEKNIC